MNYTINEVSNQLINTTDHDNLSFFYKFELKTKEEFASIELNPYVDEDKARLMAANIIAEKIASKLIYHKVRDADTISRTVLSFSERHVETEERESYEQLENELLKRISIQKETIATRTETTKYLIVALLLVSGLFIALNILPLFN